MRPPRQAEVETNDEPLHSLTRCNTETGARYERLPEVEAQARGAIRLELSSLIEAARRDYESPLHIKDETLCCLVREALRAGEDEKARAIVEALLRRHAGTIDRRVRCGGIELRHRADCASEIVTHLLTQLFDVNSDRSDFAQVRFGLFFERLCNPAISKFRKLQQREAQTSSVAYSRDDAEEEIDLPATLVDERIFSAEDRAMMRDALAHLSDDLRTTFILRYFEGWQIEADSPLEPSISRYLNVTPRTVRNRLQQAEASLNRWREGKRLTGKTR